MKLASMTPFAVAELTPACSSGVRDMQQDWWPGGTYQGQDSCQVGSYVLVSNIHGGLILLFGGGFFR